MKVEKTLFLLPNLLDRTLQKELLPRILDEVVPNLDGIVAESEKGARIFLSLFSLLHKNFPILIYNEHSKDSELDEIVDLLLTGKSFGLISDAGIPCVADPGHLLVRRAKEKGISVRAFMGPSSILLGLMLSGFPGQRFSFHGYLSREPKIRRQEILQMERTSKATDETAIFMETPYRNQSLLQSLLETLSETTLLSVAWDLTLPSERVETADIFSWRKKNLPDLSKKPAVFLIYAKTSSNENSPRSNLKRIERDSFRSNRSQERKFVS